jgi:hypothetical protein
MQDYNYYYKKMKKTLLCTFIILMFLAEISVLVTSQLSNFKAVSTKYGNVYCIPTSMATPSGYRVLRYEEGTSIAKDKLTSLLEPWYIAGFNYGQLSGTAYGNQYSPFGCGLQCGHRFIRLA